MQKSEMAETLVYWLSSNSTEARASFQINTSMTENMPNMPLNCMTIFMISL